MRIGTDHVQKTKAKRCVVLWDITKVGHTSKTSTLFAFQNMLHCASWPRMSEMCSSACPTLVLSSGSAESGSKPFGIQASGLSSKPETLPSKEGRLPRLFSSEARTPWKME